MSFYISSGGGSGGYVGDCSELVYSGSSSLYDLRVDNNLELSGDTSNWYVDNTTYCYINDTSLYGNLKHNNEQSFFLTNLYPIMFWLFRYKYAIFIPNID